MSPYHNIKIQAAREEYIKTWKENIEREKTLADGAEVEDVDMKIDFENENEEIIAQDDDQSRDENNSVNIEEMNMNEFDDDKEDEYVKNLDHLTEEVAKFNEDNLIIKNICVFNEVRSDVIQPRLTFISMMFRFVENVFIIFTIIFFVFSFLNN